MKLCGAIITILCCNGGLQLEDLLFDLSVTGHLLMALKAQSGMTQVHAQANHSLALGDLLPSDHQLLVNLATHIRLYQPDIEAATTVLDTGITIALQILGQDIFRHLYADKTDRQLRIILPEPNASPASAAMADLLFRIPWEIARPSRSEPSLLERNLRVCIVPASPTPAPIPAPLGKTFRILFIHAEAPGSIPLALRQERRALQALFRDHIEPGRNVEAHFLAHGVTRAHIAEQIRRHGGYHIIHWSGHGQHNLLELVTADGTPDHISGAELLALLQQEASILPRLCFLSACDSAGSAAIHNWGDFLAAPGTEAVDDGASLTSTAHTLYTGGVASVIAMRFPVGDAYARELALVFYARLLAGKDTPGVAGALQQARQQCSGANHCRARMPNVWQQSGNGCHTRILWGAAVKWPR